MCRLDTWTCANPGPLLELCNVLCNGVQYSTLQYIQCSTAQCSTDSALQRSPAQYIAVHYSPVSEHDDGVSLLPWPAAPPPRYPAPVTGTALAPTVTLFPAARYPGAQGAKKGPRGRCWTFQGLHVSKLVPNWMPTKRLGQGAQHFINPLGFNKIIFTEAAPRPIKSISCDVRLFVCGHFQLKLYIYTNFCFGHFNHKVRNIFFLNPLLVTFLSLNLRACGVWATVFFFIK